jgi:DNA-binding MarR family transcriptional regulator
MSAKATRWALGSGAGGSAQAVLLALAAHHSARTGECRPSLKTLCATSGVTRPTVCKALDALRSAGLVTWTKGADARGQRATNLYSLRLEGDPRVKLLNSGKGDPRVKSSDVGSGVPELSCFTRLISKKEKGLSEKESGAISRDDDGVACLPAEIVWAQPRRAFVAPAPRHPTPAQIDAAITGAWRAFEAADDPRSVEAWA